MVDGATSDFPERGKQGSVRREQRMREVVAEDRHVKPPARVASGLCFKAVDQAKVIARGVIDSIRRSLPDGQTSLVNALRERDAGNVEAGQPGAQAEIYILKRKEKFIVESANRFEYRTPN